MTVKRMWLYAHSLTCLSLLCLQECNSSETLVGNGVHPHKLKIGFQRNTEVPKSPFITCIYDFTRVVTKLMPILLWFIVTQEKAESSGFVLVSFTDCYSYFLCVCISDVTVRQSDLKPCEKDDRVCVTDVRDCGPRRSSSEQSENTHTCTAVKYLDSWLFSSFLFISCFSQFPPLDLGSNLTKKNKELHN